MKKFMYLMLPLTLAALYFIFSRPRAENQVAPLKFHVGRVSIVISLTRQRWSILEENSVPGKRSEAWCEWR